MANSTKKTKSNTTKYLRRVLEEKSTELRAHMMTPETNALLRVDEEIHDSADLAERSHETWVWVTKNSFDVMLLREIEDALGRLRKRSYGTCMDCGRPVAQKRLEAVPWTRYCVACQEKQSPSMN